MATDTEMLDFLEAIGESSNLKWMARPSITGRGWRLHQDPQGEHETARAALEAAMMKTNPEEVLIAQRNELLAALRYVMEDDGLIPRASSECRKVIAAIIAKVTSND